MTLHARRTELAATWEAVNDHFYEQRLSDGLPVVPPTQDRVLAMLEGVGREPNEGLGVLPPRFAPVTIEKVAINAVMAGCMPGYLPVVLAGVEAVLDPQFNLYGIQATTGPPGTLMVVNGPVARQLGINGGSNCLGPGWCANATIGRALRLLLNNVGGALPKDTRRSGVGDMATFGWPGKYTACFAENEEALPAGWRPFHVERGLARESSAVTVFGTGGFVQFSDRSPDAQDVAATIAAGISFREAKGGVRAYGQPLVLIGIEHAAVLAAGGYDQARLREELYERTTVDPAQLPREHVDYLAWRNQPLERGGRLGVADSPDDILLVVAGGEGSHSAFLPPWSRDTRCVTRPVQ